MSRIWGALAQLWVGGHSRCFPPLEKPSTIEARPISSHRPLRSPVESKVSQFFRHPGGNLSEIGRMRSDELIEAGAWRVADHGNRYVVVEVGEHAAYAYLWDKTRGVLSHVWLFNRQSSESHGERLFELQSPPPMPRERIRHERYRVPVDINEISCEFDEQRKEWILAWLGVAVAVLPDSNGPGRSSFVNESSELAEAWEEFGAK